MTDTDEFLKRGHEASFFKDLMDRVSIEAEKQYFEFARDACKDEPVEIVGRDWKPDRDEMDFKAGLDRYLTRSDWD